MKMFCPRSIFSVALSLLSSMMLCSCANQGYSVIAFTATTIGVNISQQPANGSLDATLGYKRAEVAFVPTNRNSGDSAGTTGNGAKDSANVIMELRYSGIFSTGADSGIYQRLAVGDIAVAENGTALLFAKGPDGKIDADAAKALSAVSNVPAPDPEATAAIVPLSEKYQSIKKDPAMVKKFNDAAKAEGFKDFGSFLRDLNTTPQQVKAVRENLEKKDISFDK